MPGLTNVFVEDHAKLLYRKHFDQSTRILVRDGFKRQRNADYPAMEEFSDLHVTYGDHGMAGFGDFLIVGDVYSEGGGTAYAVAIHLTFIDPDKDDVIYIDRKRVVEGKSLSVRVDLGGRRTIKKKKLHIYADSLHKKK